MPRTLLFALCTLLPTLGFAAEADDTTRRALEDLLGEDFIDGIDQLDIEATDDRALLSLRDGKQGGATLLLVQDLAEPQQLARFAEPLRAERARFAPDGCVYALAVHDAPRIEPSHLQFQGLLYLGNACPGTHGNTLTAPQPIGSEREFARVLGWLDQDHLVVTRFLPGDLPQQRAALYALSSNTLQDIEPPNGFPNTYAHELIGTTLYFSASPSAIITLPAAELETKVYSLDLSDAQAQAQPILSLQGELARDFHREGQTLHFQLDARRERATFELGQEVGKPGQAPNGQERLERFALPPLPSPRLGPGESFPMPFVHQVYDTADDHDGRASCGPTSTLMAILHFGRLDPWPMTASTPTPHTSPYGQYISRVYTAFGTTFNRGAPDYSGKICYGAHGWCTEDGLGWAWRMQDYAEKHDLETEFFGSSSFDQVRSAIAQNRVVVLSTQLTSGGHIITVKGFTSDNKVIVNDPYGNRNQGYMNYNGEDVVYTWAELSAKWFITVWGTPSLPCPSFGPEGAILDNAGPCYRAHGSSQYWHYESAGWEGGLWWTIAWEKERSNWGQWLIQPSQAGEYEVEVYTVPDFGQSKLARYEVVHNDQTTELRLDQSTTLGWQSLGHYYFRTGEGQYVSVNDDTGELSSLNLKIMADAVRISPWSPPVEPEPEPEPERSDVDEVSDFSVEWPELPEELYEDLYTDVVVEQDPVDQSPDEHADIIEGDAPDLELNDNSNDNPDTHPIDSPRKAEVKDCACALHGNAAATLSPWALLLLVGLIWLRRRER
ncbi:MAG: C39 family peptidase [Myxococcota bacterium]|jgi:hypothetical protein|nr:C39 family peptidase [Myxococcota bacterium]